MYYIQCSMDGRDMASVMIYVFGMICFTCMKLLSTNPDSCAIIFAAVVRLSVV